MLSAYFAGGVTTLGAIMGLFALFGIAARNSILLIRCYQSLESINGTSKRLDIVWRATRENAGPIMLAAGATTAALIPVLLFGSVAGTEVLFPLAVVIVGGLVSSSLFTLLLVPTMYLGFAPAPTHDLVTTLAVNGSTNGSQVEVLVGGVTGKTSAGVQGEIE